MSSIRIGLGPSGPRGSKGYQGAIGLQGGVGSTGSQGEQGPQGGLADELNKFQDVDIISPQDGETLIYGTGTNTFTNSSILHSTIDFSTITEHTGAGAATEALGVNKFYVLLGDDCLRVTSSTGP